MRYLTVPPARSWWPAMSEAGLGVMCTPKSGVRLALATIFPAWAADNGCYAAGDRFDLTRYLVWLDAMQPAARSCLFATAPDVVGDAVATLARSLPVLPELRQRGYRAALVAQDGLERLSVPWATFDVLFVGGTTAWKLSEAAYGLVAEARWRGKGTHLGRVNAWPRLRMAAVSGYDSADGTTLGYNPGRYIPEIRGWLDTLRQQGRLNLWEATA